MSTPVMVARRRRLIDDFRSRTTAELARIVDSGTYPSPDPAQAEYDLGMNLPAARLVLAERVAGGATEEWVHTGAEAMSKRGPRSGQNDSRRPSPEAG